MLQIQSSFGYFYQRQPRQRRATGYFYAVLHAHVERISTINSTLTQLCAPTQSALPSRIPISVRACFCCCKVIRSPALLPLLKVCRPTVFHAITTLDRSSSTNQYRIHFAFLHKFNISSLIEFCSKQTDTRSMMVFYEKIMISSNLVDAPRISYQDDGIFSIGFILHWILVEIDDRIE